MKVTLKNTLWQCVIDHPTLVGRFLVRSSNCVLLAGIQDGRGKREREEEGKGGEGSKDKDTAHVR